MSEEVKDDNPYSRLMALKKMGIVTNYADIKQKTVLVVGVGGIGSVTTEMLTRCGIGKLIFYDYDKVELANMNRLFFTPLQVGLSKSEAARETLQLINPEIVIEAYNFNITSNEGYEHLHDRITKGSLTDGPVDLVLSCVDNYSARMAVNSICNQVNQIWFESGVSESALSGHIQVLVPGETGCFACASPLAVAEGTEGTIKREGVCAASLPTTMGIIAGFLSQATLKFLLNFGTLAHCLSYNAQSDFFTSYKIAINSECKEPSCQRIQKLKATGEATILIGKVERPKKEQAKVEHKVNEWGIEVVEESQKEGGEKVEVKEGESVEDLMGELENL